VEQSDVRQRVAERADLPVEDGDDLAVVGHDRVVESVVAMDDRRRALLGDASGEGVVDVLDQRELPRLLLVELPVPPLELAGDVALMATEVGQPDRLDVDGVERGHRVDERATGVGPRRRRQHRLGERPLADDVAVDEAHHVVRHSVHVRVIAVAE
jgi:hypothetical protein